MKNKLKSVIKFTEVIKSKKCLSENKIGCRTILVVKCRTISVTNFCSV